MNIDNPETVGLWEKQTLLDDQWNRIDSIFCRTLTDVDVLISERGYKEDGMYIVVSESYLQGQVYMRGNYGNRKWTRYGTLIGFA